MKSTHLHWLAVLCWMALIFALSHEPADGSQARSDVLVNILQTIGLGGSADLLSTVVRKLAHAVAYAVLGVLLVWALAARRRVTAKLVMYAVAITCLYAISDELHQTYVPGRSGEVRDVAVDAAGALIGASAVAYVLHIRRSTPER